MTIGIFCDKCGKILMINEKDKENKVRCSCGFEKIILERESSTTEHFKEKPKKGHGAVEGTNNLATFPHLCKKCGYDKAQVIEMGVWYSDEAGVVRYKCGKCGFTEQDKESNT